MLTNIWILCLGTLIAGALFWVVPADRPRLRQGVLTGISMLLVLLYSFGGFFFCLCLAVIPLLAQRGFAVRRSKWTFWVFMGLAVSPMVGLRLFTDQSFLIAFGVAFATVKSLGLVMISYSGRQRLKALDVFLLIFFFPLFTVGPVERLATFAQDAFGGTFRRAKVAYGFYRIGTGLFLVMFVCADLLEPIRDQWFGRGTQALAGLSQMEALGLITASFLYTYLNFEGFSSIAIGLSRFFGLRVTENFDRPLMVTNLAEFWKRYHISMGNWINQFIFFPLVLWMRRSWAPYAATVIAFILFGLWHAFDLNYLVWGLGNGLGVAVVQYGTARKIFPLFKSNRVFRPVAGLLGGAATLVFIAWIQTFANLDSFGDGVTLTAKLLGVG